MQIVGLRIEKYIGTVVKGHNCDFNYEDGEFEKHIICAFLKDKKVEITLSRSQGICGSGWTTATFGHITVEEVERFNGFTYIPKKPLFVVDDLDLDYTGDVKNKVFEVSNNGGNHYYPYGYYSVNMDLFEETIRSKKLRPVWIFKGKSNSGKSFLASKLKDLKVYETDSNEFLPNDIIESVIVLGNKYPFTVEEVTKNIFGEAEIIVVNFD